jgi:uncharacterized protein YbjT (DUF2867 family)
VGGHLLSLLLADETYFRVIVLTRQSLGFEHLKLMEYEVNFDQLRQHENVIKGEDVFCCLGSTIKKAGSQEAFRNVDFTYVLQTAAISRKNGAHQFLVVSSLGADAHSRVFYSRVKGEMEEAVARIPFDAVKIFRPSLLLGDRNESRFAETLAAFFFKALSALLLFGGMRRYRAIQAETVAKAMLRAAKQKLDGVQIIESEEIQTLGLL